MPRTVPLTFRAAGQAQTSDVVPAMLLTITHESMAEPVRLSSDPTVNLSLEPLLFGTRHQGDEYLFVIMSAVLPDDLASSPPQASLAFANVEKSMTAVLRSITTPAVVDIAVVDASDPDVIVAEYKSLQTISSSYTAAQVTLEVGREPMTSEPCPCWRMTKSAFPAVHS